MTYEDAKVAADLYTWITGKESYVYWDKVDGIFDWCDADAFFYVNSGMVYDLEVVYSTVEGRYG